MSKVVVIPDVHGRLDLLDQILIRVQRRFSRDSQLLFLGDLIDRGPDAAAVLRRVYALSREGTTVLMGNHEDTFIGFLNGNARAALRFAFWGGADTLDSFVRERGTPFTTWQELREYLEADGLYPWLAALPHHVVMHSISATHAPVPRAAWVNNTPTRFASLWGAPEDQDDPQTWSEWLWAQPGATAVCGHVCTPRDIHGRRQPFFAGRGYFLDCGCSEDPASELVAAFFEGGQLIETLRSGG